MDGGHIKLTYCDLKRPYDVIANLVNLCLGSGLFSDDSKPVPKPMLTVCLFSIRYYAVCFLNQLILSPKEKDVAARLITIYFSFFKVSGRKYHVGFCHRVLH